MDHTEDDNGAARHLKERDLDNLQVTSIGGSKLNVKGKNNNTHNFRFPR